MSKNKIPPIILAHPHDGSLRIGREDKDVLRKADCQLKAGSDATLRLFRDGGWELRSKRGIETDNAGSNIIQSGSGPLNIKVDGDFNIECGGEFNVNAKKIVMTANDAVDGNIKLTANQDYVTIYSVICCHNYLLSVYIELTTTFNIEVSVYFYIQRS
jgi:hypothetical protein